VPEEDEVGLERGQLLGRPAVLVRVGREEVLGEAEARDAGHDVHVVEDVADDQRSIGFAEEHDVAGRVARGGDDLEAGDLVAVAKDAVHLVGRPGEYAGEELGEEVVGLALADQLRVLGGLDVAVGHPVGDVERGTDLVRGSLVVGMGVREGMRRDGVSFQIAEDALPRAPGAGVDQDVLDEEGVDAVGEEERVQVPNTVGELLHAGESSLRGCEAEPCAGSMP
jgi:hypothetical protein